jgi:trehalose/maltose hydrolase-like predicted phosphorylase
LPTGRVERKGGFLAGGDSIRLARVGFPVIRGTADFWVSRSTFDSSAYRFHIRDVVSVAEGLFGVSDDAYTNALARLDLRIAAAAARRLGLRADPRWTEVADRLPISNRRSAGWTRRRPER